VPQALWKIPDQILVQKILKKMYIGTDKIREIVNDSDSDGSGFSEISDSDTCMVEYILTTINKKLLFDKTEQQIFSDQLLLRQN
jgi:hypothetical protein